MKTSLLGLAQFGTALFGFPSDIEEEEPPVVDVTDYETSKALTGTFEYGMPVVITPIQVPENITTGSFEYNNPVAIYQTVIVSNPSIAYINPQRARRGFSYTVAIYGADFKPGVFVMFSGSGIKVDSIEFKNVNWVNVKITIDATATANRRDVLLLNPDGGTTTFTQAFLVLAFNASVYTRKDYSETWKIYQYDKNMRPIADVSKTIHSITIDKRLYERHREKKITIQSRAVIPDYFNTYLKVFQFNTEAGVETEVDHGFFILASPTINETISGKVYSYSGADRYFQVKKKRLDDLFVIDAGSDIEKVLEGMLTRFRLNPISLPYLNQIFANQVSFNANTELVKVIEDVCSYFDGEFYFNSNNVLCVNPRVTGKFWGDVGRASSSKTMDISVDIDDDEYYNKVVIDWGTVKEERNRVIASNDHEIQRALLGEVILYKKIESITSEEQAQETADSLLAYGSSKKQGIQLSGKYWTMNIGDIVEYERNIYRIREFSCSKLKEMGAKGELYEQQ